MRIEHLIKQKHGWVFSSWEYLKKDLLESVIDKAPLMAWLYTKKIASSRGEEVPKEYVELFKAKVGEEKLKDLEKAYEEAISIRNSSELKEFLERYISSKWDENYADRILGAGRGGKDLAWGEHDVSKIEKETSKFEKKLEAALESSKEGQPAPQAGPRSRRGEGGVRFIEGYLPVNPNEHLKKYLSWLYTEEVQKVKSKEGGRLNVKEYVKWRARGSPNEENLALFTRLQKAESPPKIVLIVDTSGSMDVIGEKMRELLWAVAEMSKKGLLEGKVVFTGDGDALAVSLPTNKPIWSVEFTGGTNGYDKALEHINDAEFVILLCLIRFVG